MGSLNTDPFLNINGGSIITDFFDAPLILIVVLSNKAIWENQINNYLYRSKKSKRLNRKGLKYLKNIP